MNPLTLEQRQYATGWLKCGACGLTAPHVQPPRAGFTTLNHCGPLERCAGPAGVDTVKTFGRAPFAERSKVAWPLHRAEFNALPFPSEPPPSPLARSWRRWFETDPDVAESVLALVPPAEA